MYIIYIYIYIYICICEQTITIFKSTEIALKIFQFCLNSTRLHDSLNVKKCRNYC